MFQKFIRDVYIILILSHGEYKTYLVPCAFRSQCDANITCYNAPIQVKGLLNFLATGPVHAALELDSASDFQITHIMQ